MKCANLLKVFVVQSKSILAGDCHSVKTMPCEHLANQEETDVGATVEVTCPVSNEPSDGFKGLETVGTRA